jgi:OST-HTH/LOTUS domain
MLPDDMLDSLHSILYDLAKDEKTGWVNMIDFIRIWRKEQPDFQLKTYVYISFKKLFNNHPDGFEIRTKPSRKNGISPTDVRTLHYFPQVISTSMINQIRCSKLHLDPWMTMA